MAKRKAPVRTLWVNRIHDTNGKELETVAVDEFVQQQIEAWSADFQLDHLRELALSLLSQCQSQPVRIKDDETRAEIKRLSIGNSPLAKGYRRLLERAEFRCSTDMPYVKPTKFPADWKAAQKAMAADASRLMFEIRNVEIFRDKRDLDSAIIAGFRIGAIAMRLGYRSDEADAQPERKRRKGHADKFAAEAADRKARAIELYRELRPKHRKKTRAVERVAKTIGVSKGKVWEYLRGIE